MDIELEGVVIAQTNNTGLYWGVLKYCRDCGQVWARIPGTYPKWYAFERECRLHPTKEERPDRPVINGSLVSSTLVWPRSWETLLRSCPDLLLYEFLLHLDFAESQL